MYRTHNCGELRKDSVGKTIELAGWVQTVRDLGGVVFIDLRDQYGITQIVTSGDEKLVDEISRIPVESTITITGTVRERAEETINKKLPTGEIEVVIEKYEIFHLK